MSLNGKWIDGIRPDGSVCDAARASLAMRLAAVGYWLPLAADHADQDVEHVHRLRVSTRRAIAALKLYSDWLPAKPHRWLKKRLKKIRRAAGDARDLDVLADRILRHGGESAEPFLEEIAKRREAAQPAIIEIAARCRHQECFSRKTLRLLERLKPPESFGEANMPMNFRDWARLQLAATADSFFQSLPDDHADTAMLHQFRIRAKALRYTIELLASALDPSIRTVHYPIVEELQERLGEINDLATGGDQMRRWSEGLTDASHQQVLGDLASEESAQLSEKIDAFRDWWVREQCDALRKGLSFNAHGPRGHLGNPGTAF